LQAKRLTTKTQWDKLRGKLNQLINERRNCKGKIPEHIWNEQREILLQLKGELEKSQFNPDATPQSPRSSARPRAEDAARRRAEDAARRRAEDATRRRAEETMSRPEWARKISLPLEFLDRDGDVNLVYINPYTGFIEWNMSGEVFLSQVTNVEYRMNTPYIATRTDGSTMTYHNYLVISGMPNLVFGHTGVIEPPLIIPIPYDEASSLFPHLAATSAEEHTTYSPPPHTSDTISSHLSNIRCVDREIQIIEGIAGNSWKKLMVWLRNFVHTAGGDINSAKEALTKELNTRRGIQRERGTLFNDAGAIFLANFLIDEYFSSVRREPEYFTNDTIKDNMSWGGIEEKEILERLTNNSWKKLMQGVKELIETAGGNTRIAQETLIQHLTARGLARESVLFVSAGAIRIAEYLIQQAQK